MERYGIPSAKKAPEPVMIDPEKVDVLIELARAILTLAQREQPVPVVNVEVRVPEQPSPVVNVTAPTVSVTPQINVPEPVVNVDVNVPKQAPAVVRFDPDVNVSFPQVMDMRVVSVPDARITRDDKGRMSGVETPE